MPFNLFSGMYQRRSFTVTVGEPLGLEKIYFCTRNYIASFMQRGGEQTIMWIVQDVNHDSEVLKNCMSIWALVISMTSAKILTGLINAITVQRLLCHFTHTFSIENYPMDVGLILVQIIQNMIASIVVYLSPHSLSGLFILDTVVERKWTKRT